MACPPLLRLLPLAARPEVMLPKGELHALRPLRQQPRCQFWPPLLCLSVSCIPNSSSDTLLLDLATCCHEEGDPQLSPLIVAIDALLQKAPGCCSLTMMQGAVEVAVALQDALLELVQPFGVLVAAAHFAQEPKGQLLPLGWLRPHVLIIVNALLTLPASKTPC